VINVEITNKDGNGRAEILHHTGEDEVRVLVYSSGVTGSASVMIPLRALKGAVAMLPD
jgi:hypothetical protein